MSDEEISQKQLLINEMLKRLVELGVDISKDDYYKNPKFLELKKSYISGGKVTETEAWWIEKNIVGQERLKKIYGKYTFGITEKLTYEEMKDEALFTALADKYPEKCRTEADIRKYFYRKEQSEKNGNKFGLIGRLRQWGLDIDAFDSRKERIKLLYFLCCFEEENNMLISIFLNKPTLENVDNGFVGDETKNGSLMADIKRTVAREINPDYIFMLNNTIVTLVSEWEEQIKKVMYDLDTCESRDLYGNLERMNKYVKIIADMVNSPMHGVYKDSLLETFYLKMVQHESLGRENDILDVADFAMEFEEEEVKYQPDKYKKFAFEVIRKDEIHGFVKENRREVAQLVFEHDKVTSNEYQKFDKAVSKVDFCIKIYNENTFAWQLEIIPTLMVIIIIQEIVKTDKKEILDNKFYRYTSTEQRTLNTELSYGTSAFRKNQLAWVAKLMRRYNMYKGKYKETIIARSIERNIDRIMIKIFSCNSMNDMIYIHNFLMMWLDAVLVDEKKIHQEIKFFEKSVGRREKGYKVVGNPYILHVFFGSTINSSIPELLAKKITKKISEAKQKNLGNVPVEWPVELQFQVVTN